ncbi:hypothetical protein G9F31_00785 [Acinetobacter sp. 187]|uniref:hypothetical protein n=1 Tax=Acinetobacter lanii TaxID=2715163 RepID=UPI0014079CB6|nr:hypothetical protein [Acinetobacter lanii]NHC02320.1 hypothetical protein [Acinetobacter lanii]
MSTKLGTLTLDLVAKIGSFVGPIRDAERQTETSFNNMRKHVNGYGAIAIAASAAVGAGVMAMAKEYADAAAEIRIFSNISNATTEEFQKMAAGAQTVGISTEKLSDQLKDFNEKLGEFVTIGSGGAVDFFEQIATKTEGSAEAARKLALEMQNLSGPKALQLYVDKLEEAGVTQQQMSFYLESMASDTTNLIPLLKNGGEGFKFWADAAERAGIIMDESAIQKAAELKVQLGLLDMQVTGVKNQFIQGLMPALVSVGDAMSQGAADTNLMSEAGETLGNVFKGVAATGMGVYAVVKMLSNAIAGLSFDAVNAKKTVDMAAEKGTWADKLPGVKFAKTALFGATMASAPNSGVQMAAQDNAKVADDVANSINKIYSDAANSSAKAMAKIQQSQAGVTKGSQEWVDKQNKASEAAKKNAKATSDAAKALQEYNKSVELGKRLIYEYGDEQVRIAEDLKKDLAEINESALKPEAKGRYIAVATAQAEARKKLYVAELDSELYAHLDTQEQKLDNELRIAKLRLDSQRGLNANELSLRKQALEQKHKQEKAWLALERAQALNNAQDIFQSDIQRITARYEFEREQIRLTQSMSKEDRDALIGASYRAQDYENDQGRQGAWSDYQNAIGIDTSAEDARSQREDAIKAAFEWQLITQEEYQQKLLESEAAYHQSKRELALASAGGMIDNMATTMGALLGEQSSGLKAMFMVQKTFAIAEVLLNAPKSFSKAYDAVIGIPYVGPYLAPVAGGVAIAAQLAQVASLQSVNVAGMAHDGIDNIPKEGTWLLDKGERVVDRRTNGDLKDFIAKGGNGGVTVNVNVPVGYIGKQSTDAEGNVTIDVVKREILNSWSNLGRANSHESRQLEAYGAQRTR